LCFIWLGHIVADLRLIFRIVSPSHPSLNHFLIYVQRFDIIPQLNKAYSRTRGSYPESHSSLYLLKRARRSNGTLMGDVIPLVKIRSLADLIPNFGQSANRSLTKENSMIYSAEYRLNKYFNKEFFLALSLSE
jgi:hypothetical protein